MTRWHWRRGEQLGSVDNQLRVGGRVCERDVSVWSDAEKWRTKARLLSSDRWVMVIAMTDQIDSRNAREACWKTCSNTLRHAWFMDLMRHCQWFHFEKRKFICDHLNLFWDSAWQHSYCRLKRKCYIGIRAFCWSV